MTEKNKTHLSLFLAVLIVAAGWSAYLYSGKSGMLASDPAVPSQAEWDAALATSTNKTLFGFVAAVGDRSVSMVVRQPDLGTTSVAVGSSTSVIKNIPFSAEEMAAAFEEFKKGQAASDGKPSLPPNPFKTTVLSLADLRVGDTVLITLAQDSAQDAFAAGKIEVLPPMAMPAAAPTPIPMPDSVAPAGTINNPVN
jgi:hypothetical protein